MKLDHYHAYRTRSFWIVFLVTTGLIVITSSTLYYYISRVLFTQTQQDLRSIAEKTVALIPVDVHEKLQKPDDQNSDGYKQIEAIFKSVMAGNPKIDDIYTLRPTNSADTMTFVVSGKETADYNHNNVIDENEIKVSLGETFDVTGLSYLKQGFTEPSYDHAITYDKWGAWLSGYAPLKDAQGKTVAVLGVDYSAQAASSNTSEFLTIIVRVAITMIPFCFLCALWLGRRIHRPVEVMTKAMHHIMHGEPNYRIPTNGKNEEKVIAEFFNTTKDVLWDEAKRQAEKEDKE